MTSEQLKRLFDDTYMIQRSGTGSERLDPHAFEHLEENEGDTGLIAWSIEDKDDGVEYNFTFQAFLDGTFDPDDHSENRFQFLKVKDTRGRDHFLRFVFRAKHIDLRLYFGIETEETTGPIVWTVMWDIDNEGSDVEVYGCEEMAWGAAAMLAVNHAPDGVAAELEKLYDLQEYKQCVERWQKVIDDSGIGYINVGYQSVNGGVKIEKEKVSIREDGDYTIIEPAPGYWLDVRVMNTGRLTVEVKKSNG